MSEPKTSKECTKPPDKVKEPEESEKQEGQEKGEEPKDKTYVPPPPYKPSIPYPQRLKQTQINNQYQKFIKVKEKLHVEIPFTKAITKYLLMQSFSKTSLPTNVDSTIRNPWNTVLFPRIS